MPHGPSDKDEREFRARMDLEALRTVAEMRKDKKRLAAVRAMIKAEREALSEMEA